jgi:gluconokinase
MPASLLDSQIATLEPLEADERGLTVSVDQPLDRLVQGLVAELRG